ncbi:hypothetical protein H8N03_06570 [Ramlibacter sp. USB13]|uniref:Uncharacterized protein n=1 Tax=Ramlibacter cellulosilyticus TaxID=2764187 RepID=A0A923MRQ0_9BURK|nr:hypothetical protein [Ramlibacter cellulosilyticus]MBC5782602.1 hypothetical protein [Ramlibacter cellulosilyticus]
MTHRYKAHPEDKQTPRSGKVENDTNKQGHEKATQTNEGRRTAASRHDREDHIGNNQVKMRRGSTQGTSSQQPPMKEARGGNKRGM